MSSISSTSTLPSWDPMDLFSLINPDTLSLTCTGYASSKRRQCHNVIAYHNIQAAKEVMRQLVRPGVEVDDLKEMLHNLAEYTLCRGANHQSQATEVSDRWFELVRRERGEEEDWGSDTSDDDNESDDESDDRASSTSRSSDDEDEDDDKSSDDDGGATPPRTNNSAQELRRRLDELESLQREFEALLQTQRRSLRNRMPTPSLTPQQPQSNLQHASNDHSHNSSVRQRQEEHEALHAAEQTHQEETYLTSELERASTGEQLRRKQAEQAKQDEARRQAQIKAEAEADRLPKDQTKEYRLKRERQATSQETQQPHTLSWESAWSRYEAAWSIINITRDDANESNFDIRSSQIWPTKSGSFLSCCEEDVKVFFRCQPGDSPVSRQMLRRQALRWHPDRAARLFEGVVDGVVRSEVLKTVTMISQVVIGIMGVTAR